MAKKIEKGGDIEQMIMELEFITKKIDEDDIEINQLLETYKHSAKLINKCKEELYKIENLIIEYDK